MALFGGSNGAVARVVSATPPSLRSRPAAVVAAAAAVATLSLLVPPAVRSYRGYLALGPGGIPYNVFGWLIQGLIQPIAVDMLDGRPLVQPSPLVAARYGDAGAKAYWTEAENDIKSRAGARPDVPPYVAPQRQMSDRPDDVGAMCAAMGAFVDALVAANAAALAVRPSELEGRGTPALYVPAPAASTGSGKTDKIGPFGAFEFCHIHPEASSHIIFSLPDGARVMNAGWGQRHALSGATIAGCSVGMPLTYLFVYAPRDADELRVWRQLVVAAARFATGGKVPIAVPTV